MSKTTQRYENILTHSFHDASYSNSIIRLRSLPKRGMQNIDEIRVVMDDVSPERQRVSIRTTQVTHNQIIKLTQTYEIK